ncbi:MAG TPA: tyrosine-type recombinase/integrase [Bryobacteraceae bacterium]|nr:tyrosine-type recombinase/integrase [Bryobacteraceae bacterium]
MLTVYRRHTEAHLATGRKACPHAEDRFWKRCKCTCWVQGNLPDGTLIRESLKTRSWEAAEAKARQLMTPERATEDKNIPEAIRLFKGDAKKRLAASTYRKHRYLLNDLQDYADCSGFKTLKQLTHERVREFRHTWKDKNRSARKKLERLKSFFRVCLDSGWIERDPTRGIKIGDAEENPTLPFTDDQMQSILEHCPDEWTRTFVLTLRYTGLRISDAALLTCDRFDGKRISLYQAKTKEWVFVPIPAILQNALSKTPLRSRYYFLRGQSTRLETVTDLWRRALSKVFTNAGIPNGHPHRFRDTFAIALLTDKLHPVSLESVSLLLGHSSIKITERHYRPFVKALQAKLEDEVMKVYAEPRLRRVK